MRKKILFVGDGGDPSALSEILAGSDIEVFPKINPQSLSLGVLMRHFGYFRLALFAVRHRKHYDCVLIWQQFVALYYYLLGVFMWGERSTPVILYYIIYKKSSNKWVNWVKHRVMRAMVNSKQMAVVYFMSRSDYLYEDTHPAKRRLLVYCPFNSAFIEKNSSFIGTVGQFYFSGGASNRDYSQIKQLAESMPGAQFSVASRPTIHHVFKPCPPNVKLYCDLYGDAFEDLVLRAKAVVIPLADPMVTSGQMVVLAAMQAGKTVFITRNNFIDDWVGRERAAGFLFEYENLEHLSYLLRTTSNTELAASGKRAREFFLEHNDEKTIYRSFAEQIRVVLMDKESKRYMSAKNG